MTDEEKIRVLKNGLIAATRWLYEGETMRKHITDDVLLDGSWAEGYIADVISIRRALRVI